MILRGAFFWEAGIRYATGVCSDVACRVAIQNTASRLRAPRRRNRQGYRHGDGFARRGRRAGESSRMVNRTGGGIFAKTAKTPPLQSAFAGMALRSKSAIAASMRISSTPHVPMSPWF